MNLIPASDTRNAWIARPAATQLTAFSGFTTPGFVSALCIVGDIAYGMVATARNAGKDEPFSYNLKLNTFNTIANVTNANTPTSPATSGEWTPPTVCVIGTRIVFTHPGFAGGAIKFGWLDISNFNSATITGDTHTNTTIDALSSNVLQAGWQVGMRITGTNIPANTFIVSIATNGLSLVLSQATTGTTAGVTLTVTGGSSAAPLWNAGDTNLHNLPSVPVAVSQMAGRAFFACGAGVVMSDSLIATQVTNAAQAITFGNGVNVTALGQLGLLSVTTGGIVQAIIVFQGVTAIQQITGDFSTSLQVNQLKGQTGTFAQLSVVPNNKGLNFIAPDGMRSIDPSGQISDAIGEGGDGITTPFIYVSVPSRMAGAANAKVLRFSTQNSSVNGSPHQEFWYDQARRVWHGPHTFPSDQIQPWADTFVIAPVGVTGKLFKSDVVTKSTSVYSENGSALTWTYQTVMLPDNQEVSMNAVIEMTIALAFPISSPTASILATATDEQGALLNQTPVSITLGAAALWGSVVWGSFIWGGGVSKFSQHRVAWTTPLVFKQAQIAFNGNSDGNIKIGNLYLKYQPLGYLIENP